MRILYFLLFVSILSTFSCSPTKKTTYPPLSVDTSEMVDPRDGRHYKTVKIGDQTWLAENLNYNTPFGSWYYENDSFSYSKTFGRLYLWSTAMNGHPANDSNPSNVQGISPPGWHIPSNSEWLQLQTFLKKFNANNANDFKMDKNAWGTDSKATNRTMFGVVPAGSIYDNGHTSYNIGSVAGFISTTLTYNSNDSSTLGPLFDNNASEFKIYPLSLTQGWSVRCVKDN